MSRSFFSETVGGLLRDRRRSRYAKRDCRRAAASTDEGATVQTQAADCRPPGWSIGRWASALAPVADLARARVAVVVLGTNDCAPVCRDVDQGITRVLHTLAEAGVERVLWLNVQEDADYPDHPDEVNGRLALAAARWPQLSIVDLSRALGGRPELHSDRVHFNEAGGLALTKLVLDELDRTR